MICGEELARVRCLSDEHLLSGLVLLAGTSRAVVAGVVAHLGEVEQRRLHLVAGYGSLFAYCVARLGMSEDEAYRRIEVARLVRRFPILFEKISNGQVSLSVAALLRSHLNDDNHVELLEAISGKTVRQAREVLAAWFPQPDVLPFIRKLPQPKAALPSSMEWSAARHEHSAAVPVALGGDLGRRAGPSEGTAAGPASPCAAASSSAEPRPPSPSTAQAQAAQIAQQPTTTSRPVVPRAEPWPTTLAAPSHDDALPNSPHDASRTPLRAVAPTLRLQPLSPGRYKVQLTAGSDFVTKLELARDLLRHAMPAGDLAAILARALDLLLEQTMKRRFGVAGAIKRGATGTTSRGGATENNATAPQASQRPARETRARQAASSSNVQGALLNEQTSPGGGVSLAPAAPSVAAGGQSTESPPPRMPVPATVGPSPRGPSCNTAPASTPIDCALEDAPLVASHIPVAVRRATLARDGMRCTWRGPDGVQCECRAWLEHDHIVPRGLGGNNHPANIRLLCKAHNRLSAEQAYGRDAMARIIARRRKTSRIASPPRAAPPA